MIEDVFVYFVEEEMSISLHFVMSIETSSNTQAPSGASYHLRPRIYLVNQIAGLEARTRLINPSGWSARVFIHR